MTVWRSIAGGWCRRKRLSRFEHSPPRTRLLAGNLPRFGYPGVSVFGAFQCERHLSAARGTCRSRVRLDRGSFGRAKPSPPAVVFFNPRSDVTRVRKSSTRFGRFFGSLFSGGSPPPQNRRKLVCEELESRQLLSVAVMSPCFQTLDPATGNPAPVGVVPASGGSSSPVGYTPAQIAAAYSLPDPTGVPNTDGKAVAIVDAGSNPYIWQDIATFASYFGLPSPGSNFTVYDQRGNLVTPINFPPDAGWGLEEALDVERVYATYPNVKIDLVEADDASFANMSAAVLEAAQLPKVVAVSMSFGGGEYPEEQLYDSNFENPPTSANPNVTYVASSGDSGEVEYPACSPNVLSVGGTTLTYSNGTYSETPWAFGGSGISSFEPLPAYQVSVAGPVATALGYPVTGRMTADVSFAADPGIRANPTGFAVYDLSAGGSAAPWLDVGGTSAGRPPGRHSSQLPTSCASKTAYQRSTARGRCCRPFTTIFTPLRRTTPTTSTTSRRSPRHRPPQRATTTWKPASARRSAPPPRTSL